MLRCCYDQSKSGLRVVCLLLRAKMVVYLYSGNCGLREICRSLWLVCNQIEQRGLDLGLGPGPGSFVYKIGLSAANSGAY